MARSDVEAGERRWLEAMNGGDAAGMAANYSSDARLMPPNADILAGRDAIEAFAKEFTALGATISFQLLTVHDGGDVCAAVGTYEMELKPPGMEAQQDRGKYIEIWKRQSDGNWLIVDDIFNSSLPAPTP